MKEPLMLILMVLGILMMPAIGDGFRNADDNVSDGHFDYGFDPVLSQSVMHVVDTETNETDIDPFPTEYHLRVIGRMADGVARVKMRQGGWWECGEFYQDEGEVKDLAIEYAYHIVKASWEVSDPPYVENMRSLNEWGFAGTIWNESQWDRCALGRYPREKAYELGIIKRNRLTLSHTEDEVIKVVTDPRMQDHFNRTGFDIGLAQLLSRFYSRPDDYGYMLSLAGGALEGARAMHNRGGIYLTERPWRYWPGKLSIKYDLKVQRWARMLGASREEI